MTNYRKILEMHSQGYNQRRIKAGVRSSHQTVKAVLDCAQKLNIAWPIDGDVTNEMLDELLYGSRSSSAAPYVVFDFEYIHRELSKKGVTLTVLWQEYSETAYANGEMPNMSTQFSDKYRRWARITKATMRVTHKPGEMMQVDTDIQTNDRGHYAPLFQSPICSRLQDRLECLVSINSKSISETHRTCFQEQWKSFPQELY